MAMSHDDEDPGFWPGYVAATAGLVQGMLIMSMALGIAIFALGRISSGGPDGSLARIGASPHSRTHGVARRGAYSQCGFAPDPRVF
jgi:hypothetical protein